MHEFSEALARAIRDARNRLGITQSEASEMIEASPRTILNIENGKANPKLQILYPLIRCLKIDPAEIFFPERRIDSPAKRRLYAEIDQLSEKEAELLAPTLHIVIDMIKTQAGLYFGLEQEKANN